MYHTNIIKPSKEPAEEGGWNDTHPLDKEEQPQRQETKCPRDIARK